MSAAPCASSRRTSTSSPAASDSRWTLALAQLSGHLTPLRSSVSRAMLHPARCGRRRGHPARGQVVEPGGDRRLELVDRTARRRRQPGEPGELRAGRDALAVAVRPRRPVRVGRELRHGSPRACAAPGRPWRSHGVPPGDSKRRRPRGARCGARAPAAPSRSRAGATGAAPPRGAGHAGGAGPSRGAPGRSPSRARATRDPGHSQCIGAEYSDPQGRELAAGGPFLAASHPARYSPRTAARPMETYTLRPRPDARPDHRYRIDYAGELNRAQYEAATTLEGPVLVIAGAGSGKTRTLVYRVARLVESGVNPGQILLLTFTRRAAEEMLRRAGALGGASCERVAGGTFHSFANVVLRRTARHVGLEPNFTILDRGDSEDVVNLARSRAGLDRKDRRFPRKRAILEILSMAVNRAKPLADIVTETYIHLAEHLEDLERLGLEYARYKRQKNLVDYDDLLVLLRDLLRDQPEVAAQLSRTYRFIMVDEYQDTNPLQAEIVRGLAASHPNVMAVGDDSQSIYSFRGATFRNIMDFPKAFPDPRIVKLEENYRSTQPILDLANAIIDRAAEKHTKVLRTRRGDGPPPLLVQCGDEQAQSRFVTQRILELREEGVPLNEMAVLFRSSFHSFDLELELGRADVPFVKRGGFKFIETAHVKDVLAHLRVVANPRDAVSWHRRLRPLEHSGPRTAEDIFSHLAAAADVAGAAERLAAYPRRAAYSKDSRHLPALLRELAPDTLPPGEKVAKAAGFYSPMLRYLHPEDFPKREKDLEHFVTIAGRYRSLASLLADMALEPPTDSVGDVLAADVEEGLLTLSTIHSAKGLEWNTVFVIWLVDGRFPSYQNLHDGEEIEEERRLLYVAVTRAKEHLYLSYPIDIYDRSSGMVLGQPSRFLADLPERVLGGLQVVDEVGFR